MTKQPTMSKKYTVVPTDASQIIIAGGAKFAHSVHPDQLSYPALSDGASVKHTDACIVVRTSDADGTAGEEFVLQGDAEDVVQYPTLSLDFLSKCTGTQLSGQVSHREYMANEIVKAIVQKRSQDLVERYAFLDGQCFDHRSREAEAKAEFKDLKVGLLFKQKLDKTRGFDGLDEEGRAYLPGQEEPVAGLTASLVFMIRPGVDESHDPSFDEDQMQVQSVLPGVLDDSPYVLHQLTRGDVGLLKKVVEGTSVPWFFLAPYAGEGYAQIDIAAALTDSRQSDPDAEDPVSAWAFYPAFREVPDPDGDALSKKMAMMSATKGTRYEMAFREPEESSTDAQTVDRIMKCIRSANKTFASTKPDDKLVKAHKLAVYRELETKVKTAEESAAEWREKFEQERDNLRDKTEEMEAMERVTKRAKRGEVVIVEDGCFLVAAPGSEVFLTQQGSDKLPVPLALTGPRAAQVVIPGMPATMPQF